MQGCVYYALLKYVVFVKQRIDVMLNTIEFGVDLSKGQAGKGSYKGACAH